MKKILYYLLLASMIPLMFIFKPRQDIVFGAINESQCIRLFEDGKEFELRVRDNNLYTGTYTISKDTVFLLYQEHLEVSRTKLNAGQTEDRMNLPEVLCIFANTSQIKSSNGSLFSAEIYLDKRQESNKPAPGNISTLQNHADLITALGTNP
jgi:hypothetical protein